MNIVRTQETPASRRDEIVIAYWLLTICAAIFVMVVIGGVTRLTHSGLSMVEWEPIMGILPPLSEDAWMATFDKYKQFPEYQTNLGMDLEGFKSIFWLEYIHRVWGRTIGMVFLIPFLYFLIKGTIKRPMFPKLVIMFLLGGMQGLLGWYMVKSGLANDPYVSQYRLTAHLLAAFIIYAYIFWAALDLFFPSQSCQADLWRD
jgi:cytochrome c oxidase assembly protein subunit 15